MRVFLFLTVFYAVLIAYGINVSYAGRGGACSDPQCTEQETAGQSDDVMTQINAILTILEEKISKEKLHAIIKSAAQKNPQVADLLKIIQGYGIMTDIDLSKEPAESDLQDL